jgi:PAS domain S-box-containing protein
LSDGSIVAFHTDITEIKKNEERFSKIFQSNPALVSISTVGDAVILDVNETWLKTLGYKKHEVIGRTPFDLNLFEDLSVRERVISHSKQGGQGGFDIRYLTKSGSVGDFVISCEPIEYEGQDCYLFVAQDISAAKRTEENHRQLRDELAHVTRVATMGEMATSLAHELNQPLAALSAYVSGSLQRLKPGDAIDGDIIEALEKASEQADRAGSIIRRLRNFVAKNEPKFEFVDINDAVRVATNIMRSELKLAQIDLVLDLALSDVQVEGDPILIQQVIFNLLKNSADAVNDGRPGAGKMTVNTARDNGLVSFSIEDNGGGVAPGDQGKLFEPYFTTKEAGLGLGLPICRSIIKNLNGEIWCEPDAAAGTKFHFHLPAASLDGVNFSGNGDGRRLTAAKPV